MTTTTPVTTPATNSSASTAQAAGAAGSQQIAGNFNEFLQLLTTQLQNQDPLIRSIPINSPSSSSSSRRSSSRST